MQPAHLVALLFAVFLLLWVIFTGLPIPSPRFSVTGGSALEGSP